MRCLPLTILLLASPLLVSARTFAGEKGQKQLTEPTKDQLETAKAAFAKLQTP